MLFEEWFELLVHHHTIPHSLAEEEGRVIRSRLHELLDLTEGAQQDKHSTEHLPMGRDVGWTAGGLAFDRGSPGGFARAVVSANGKDEPTNL